MILPYTIKRHILINYYKFYLIFLDTSIRIKEGVEDIVKLNLIKVDDYYFESLFHKITLDAYRQKNFEIYCQVDEKSSWVYIKNSDDLITEMIQGFKFTELRFKICSLANHSVASRRNALDLIMQNALQLKLPNQEQPQVTQNDLLYNEIIILFENKKVGWTGGLHLSVGVKCIERLAKPLWYIDPHLKKFAKRACYLPNLFTELLTYEQNQSYNQYYSITHHKYEEVSHEKLDKLIKSFKLSLAQPWTQDTL
ncbi:hypothetical protein GLOIN_2v1885122 [Rhizophagus irregularis DAOM 181602=DAOM 197198]|uniref:Uncharacterized protein n=1 Tax=Rhizophagus irregularis (strain DAOM 181602 / DAOM 197198 / MUCL 43194) TaxID=747089 RepID=A0A2P4P1U6_RHIID|nr:hypothetical protein GLOIN_2v1885122 [Rhizophagus irregularis DAOM 181602=DAOM 197198]POG59366.1 hypothetical protein GLOIN_2v1885122 [Rhizophagus irregularis DAOM 181602=DAOM 197198]|eukprot:XP_025166232.1 hypothetical protein GLOIN_2v1885122 [Rhizophagus irregularis DAOM 181602=DAOM 197198]